MEKKEIYRFNSKKDYIQNSINFNYPNVVFNRDDIVWVNSKDVLIKKEEDFVYADRHNLYPIIGYIKRGN